MILIKECLINTDNQGKRNLKIKEKEKSFLLTKIASGNFVYSHGEKKTKVHKGSNLFIDDEISHHNRKLNVIKVT